MGQWVSGALRDHIILARNCARVTFIIDVAVFIIIFHQMLVTAVAAVAAVAAAAAAAAAVAAVVAVAAIAVDGDGTPVSAERTRTLLGVVDVLRKTAQSSTRSEDDSKSNAVPRRWKYVELNV